MPEPDRIAASAAELTTPIAQIVGVRPDRAAALRAMGLSNVGRLVAHLPMRHEREQAESTIEDLEPGVIGSARGTLAATRIAGRGRGKTRFEAVLMDDTGRLDLVFFNMAFLHNRFHPGDRLRVTGTPNRRGYGLQMANPSFEVLDESNEEPATRDARLRPVYPATEAINSRQIEEVVKRVLPWALPQIEDHLSEGYRRDRELPELCAAYRMMHEPAGDAEVADARRRLAYDELLMLQLGVHIKRMHLRRSLRSPALDHTDQIGAHIRARFPFDLTDAQDRVIREIAGDLSAAVPTNRLIQGDVGSGKTVVALYAMLMAVASGHQAALMAPTELLAEQHFASIERMLTGSQVRLGLLTGSLSESERSGMHARIADGDLDIIIGTHALITGRVAFDSLAVAIIDEQHRFGVEQRATLRVKGATDSGDLTPHVLVMTATPIPRTIGLTLFGDLDISTIDEMPPGRLPVRTKVVEPSKRPDVYTWLRERLDAGEQAFVVVPAIDTGASSGDSQLKDLRAVMKELEAGPLTTKKLAAIHGRLKRDTRAHIMERFRGDAIDCLVATTVIEVGVDVPNATVMVVEHAERFGLAQLHQLRGRVGRGTAGGVCVLVAEPTTEDARKRMKVMSEVSSGFELAERDFEIRGPGEVIGARQSGLPPFKVADLSTDTELLAMARKDAAAWVAESPTLNKPDERLARRRLLKLYGDALGIADVG